MRFNWRGVKNIVCSGLLCSLMLPLFASAEQEPAQDQAAQARLLLDAAVAHYQQEGERALAEFSRQGRFVQGDLYVYVVNANGIMLASGGPSVMLVGRDVFSHLDSEMSERFARAITSAEEGVTYESEYSWLNWNTSGSPQSKQVFYQRYGDKIFAVGVYRVQDNVSYAHALLERAMAAVEAQPQETFRAINSLSPEFYQDDLYVFVVELASGRVVAHGSDLRNIGRDFALLPGGDGRNVGRDVLAQAAAADALIEFDYRWKHPVSGRNLVKQAYARRVDGYLVIVGYYHPASS